MDPIGHPRYMLYVSISALSPEGKQIYDMSLYDAVSGKLMPKGR